MSMPWIKLTKINGNALKMFCFPFSGSSAQAYLPLAEIKQLGVDIYALEMPGRGRRFKEKMFDAIAPIVKEATEGMLQFLNGRNFIFFGHSLGGLIAFEVSRELRRRGQHLPMHLFVSGMLPPQLPRKAPAISDLSHDDFIVKLEELGGTSDDVLKHPEMLELIVPLLRKDFRIYENYQYIPDTPLKCPITAFGGSQDKYIDPEAIDRWSEQTSILFSKHIFQGGHFFLFDHLKEICAIINRTLSLHRLW